MLHHQFPMSNEDTSLPIKDLDADIINRSFNNTKEQIVKTELIHDGHKCLCCGMEPIRGPRWKCMVCVSNQVDLCKSCWNSGFKNVHHKPTHKLQKIDHIQHSYYVDGDYMDYKGDDFNYLDPNFM